MPRTLRSTGEGDKGVGGSSGRLSKEASTGRDIPMALRQTEVINKRGQDLLSSQNQSQLDKYYIGRFLVDRDTVLASVSEEQSKIHGVYRHRSTPAFATHMMADEMREQGIDRSHTPLVIISPDIYIDNLPFYLRKDVRSSEPTEWTERSVVVDGMIRLTADKHLHNEILRDAGRPEQTEWTGMQDQESKKGKGRGSRQRRDDHDRIEEQLELGASTLGQFREDLDLSAKNWWTCDIWSAELLSDSGFAAYALLQHRSTALDFRYKYTDCDRYQLYIRANFQQDQASADVVNSSEDIVDINKDRLNTVFGQKGDTALVFLRGATRTYLMRDALYELSKVGVFAEQFTLAKAYKTLAGYRQASFMLDIVRAGALFWRSVGPFSVQTNTSSWNHLFRAISTARIRNPYITSDSSTLHTRISTFISDVRSLPYPPLVRFTSADKEAFDTAKRIFLSAITPCEVKSATDGSPCDVYLWESRYKNICGQEALGVKIPSWFPYVVTPPDLFGVTAMTAFLGSFFDQIMGVLMDHIYAAETITSTSRQSMQHGLGVYPGGPSIPVKDEAMQTINQFLLNNNQMLCLEAKAVVAARTLFISKSSRDTPLVQEILRKGINQYLDPSAFVGLDLDCFHQNFATWYRLFVTINQPHIFPLSTGPSFQLERNVNKQIVVRPFPDSIFFSKNSCDPGSPAPSPNPTEGSLLPSSWASPKQKKRTRSDAFEFVQPTVEREEDETREATEGGSKVSEEAELKYQNQDDTERGETETASDEGGEAVVTAANMEQASMASRTRSRRSFSPTKSNASATAITPAAKTSSESDSESQSKERTITSLADVVMTSVESEDELKDVEEREERGELEESEELHPQVETSSDIEMRDDHQATTPTLARQVIPQISRSYTSSLEGDDLESSRSTRAIRREFRGPAVDSDPGERNVDSKINKIQILLMQSSPQEMCRILTTAIESAPPSALRDPNVILHFSDLIAQLTQTAGIEFPRVSEPELPLEGVYDWPKLNWNSATIFLDLHQSRFGRGNRFVNAHDASAWTGNEPLNSAALETGIELICREVFNPDVESRIWVCHDLLYTYLRKREHAAKRKQHEGWIPDLNSLDVLFIPINEPEGFHWYLAMITGFDSFVASSEDQASNTPSLTITVFDPLHDSIRIARTLEEIQTWMKIFCKARYKRTDVAFDQQEISVKVQSHDTLHCGIWVLWMVHVVCKFLLSDPTCFMTAAVNYMNSTVFEDRLTYKSVGRAEYLRHRLCCLVQNTLQQEKAGVDSLDLD